MGGIYSKWVITWEHGWVNETVGPQNCTREPDLVSLRVSRDLGFVRRKGGHDTPPAHVSRPVASAVKEEKKTDIEHPNPGATNSLDKGYRGPTVMGHALVG